MVSKQETDDEVDVPTSSSSARNPSISSPRHHNRDAVGANTALNDYQADCHENVNDGCIM
jgi:hypothetical protein